MISYFFTFLFKKEVTSQTYTQRMTNQLVINMLYLRNINILQLDDG